MGKATTWLRSLLSSSKKSSSSYRFHESIARDRSSAPSIISAETPGAPCVRSYLADPFVCSPSSFCMCLSSQFPSAPQFSVLCPLSLLLDQFFSHYSRDASNGDGFESESKAELERLRITVCLVGGARRFVLTGASIIQNILQVYLNIYHFAHSPLDSNAYKLSWLKDAPRRIVAIKNLRWLCLEELHHGLFSLLWEISPKALDL